MRRTARTQNCTPLMPSAEPRFDQPAAPTGPRRLLILADSAQ